MGVVCLQQVTDDDLLHLEHGVCTSFGFFRVRVTHQLAQRRRNSRSTPVGGAALPAKASIAPNSTPGWPGRPKIPGPDGDASPSTPFGAPEPVQGAKGAKRSGGGFIELLGGTLGLLEWS